MKVGDSGVFDFTSIPKTMRRTSSCVDELPDLNIGQGIEVEVQGKTALSTFRNAIGRLNRKLKDEGKRYILRQVGYNSETEEYAVGIYCVDLKEHPAPKGRRGKKSAA